MKFVLFVFLFLSTSVFANPPPELLDALPKQCQKFVSKLPADMFWDVIYVPENWNELDGKQIPIFFYGRVSGHQIPVMFFNGGPGESSRGGFNAFERRRAKQPQEQRVDFIYMDQRGTGCSGHYPAGMSFKTAKESLFYSSRSIVKDAEAIRHYLFGNKPWIVYGASYGGYIVSRYITMYPKSLVAAFSFGQPIVGILSWMKARALEQQRDWATFAQKYPSDVRRLKKLRVGIPANRCVSAHNGTLCGSVGADALFYFLCVQKWAEMHKIIKGWFEKNGSINFATYDKFVKGFALKYFVDQDVPGNVVGWRDMDEGIPDRPLMRRTTLALKKEGYNVEDWPITELRLTTATASQKVQNILDKLNPKYIDYLRLDKLAASMGSNPRLEFHVYAGGNDGFSPAAAVAHAVQELRSYGAHVTYVEFPGVGHEGQFAAQILARIFRAANVSRGDSLVHEVKR